MQPTACSSSFAPRFLLALLRSQLPPGLLEPGEEHDAAEAAGSLLDQVSAELQSAFACGGTQRRLLGRASLQALLGGGSRMSSSNGGDAGCSGSGSGGAGGGSAWHSGQGRGRPAECNGAAVRMPGSLADASSVLRHPVDSSGSSEGEGSGCDESSQAAAGRAQVSGLQAHAAAKPPPADMPHAAAAPAAATASSSLSGAARAPGAAVWHDPMLHAWSRRLALPLRGSTAGELQCLRCAHRSCLQLAPFWVLPLGIPAAAGRTLLGNVPAAPGAALEGCLAAFFGWEALQGVHCVRCSLRASLEAAGAPASGGTGSSSGGDSGDSGAAQLQDLQRVLADRSALLLESETYRDMLGRAGWRDLGRRARAGPDGAPGRACRHGNVCCCCLAMHRPA